MVVVIPVHDEPDPLTALRSLHECERPKGAIEIIIVINASDQASPEIQNTNRQAFAALSEWSKNHDDPRFRSHVLHFPDLPPKHAGVGLARKIGMDEAAARLTAVDPSLTGVIMCYDADCQCQPNLLVETLRHFADSPHIAACSTYYEHPLRGTLAHSLYDGAAAYELHLRYHIEALRQVGYPFALHTIGSSMAVKAGAYLMYGGMNRKKAGEDFYFLQKIMPVATVRELNSTTVYPSVRDSHRVPFGTGKAIRHILDGSEQLTYDFACFVDLKALIQAIQHVTDRYEDFEQIFPNPLPDSIATFLHQNHVNNAIKEIARNVTDVAQFKKRFWQWFNGFRCMKFLNWASLDYYPKKPVATEAAHSELLTRVNHPQPSDHSPRSLLISYRHHQRNTTFQT